tara:strand:+ start:928 stop:1458 length:531 start_codon:yes stop_codon:yes gene_type:complete
LEESIKILKLPGEIIDELDNWKKACDKIKDHKLSYLKLHDNIGSSTNYYQTSIPENLVSSSYWLAYTLRSCADLFGGDHRDYFIRKWDGHFDNYDVWINYSYKGNYNPSHHHSGFLSGVIYLNNQDDTIFTESNFRFKGKKGDMLLFPSAILHQVDAQEKDYERITFAFNINRREE